MLINLALRNLTRNVRRTILSLASVIAGVAVLILGQGFIGGMSENTIRAQVDTLSGHIVIRPTDYPTEGLQHPVDQLLKVTPEWESFLDDHSTGWTKRMMFTPRAVHRADAMRVRAVAWDPKTDESVFPRDQWTISGDMATSKEQGVNVSVGVARLLQLEIGDTMVLEQRTHAGSLNALTVPVAGIFRVGSPLLDRLGVLVPWDLAEELVVNEGQTSHIAMRLSSRNDAEKVASQIRSTFGDEVEVATWIDETAGMMALQSVRRAALNFLVFALMGMSAAGIANTVLMAAYERIAEVGTLRAMGMTEGDVMRLFLLEGGMMGLLGGVVGALIGGGIVAYYSQNGIDLTFMLKQTGNVPISSVLYLEWSLSVVFGAMAFGVVISVLASIYPARVASRMVPAEAVRL